MIDIRGVYLALFAATLTAILFARREPAHWPVAALLALNLCVSITRTAIAPYIAASPVGLAAFHSDQALYLVGPASLAAATTSMLTSRRWWTGAWVYVAVVLLLVLRSHDITADGLRRVYLGAQLAALLVCVAVILQAWRARRLKPATLPHFAIMFIVAVELLGVGFGPWRYGLWERWDLAQVGQVALFGMLTLLQGGALVADRER